LVSFATRLIVMAAMSAR